ncbi:hypothetical protein [Lactiplantibacillus pingfangensis]|uniref:hypothetical protein n=1 Tax=Lactiplantibacillus pingfangensis TaxID=2559915 RepID=UPI0010F84931|nr:hypothetical protein [Lactiplantibacillus pingfangensis]
MKKFEIRTPVTPLKASFVVLNAVLLLLSLIFSQVWLLASLSFGSLIILNGQFLIFQDTRDRQPLSRLSLGLTFALIIVTLLKFVVITSL